MSNKAKRNLSLAMLILCIAVYIAVICRKIFWDITPDSWQYIAPPLWIVIFLGAYRNFAQAVKEDKKYGPVK